MIAARVALAIWLSWPVIGAAAPAITGAATVDAAVVRYVIQPGDAGASIAERGLMRPQDWPQVAQMNGLAVGEPLKPGVSLAIPAALLRREPLTASVDAYSGTVTIDGGGPVKLGDTIGAGSVIATGPNSFVTLALADGSHFTLPSQSKIRIDSLDRVALDGRIERKFSIEAGRGEFRVKKRTRPGDSFLVRTPVAVAAVRGTQFRVAYDPATRKSVISVMEGVVASRSLASGGEVDVRAGIGAVVGGEGPRLKKLLSRPVLAHPRAVQDDPLVAFHLIAIKGARRHIQLARDAEFDDLIAEAESSAPDIHFDGIADGRLYVRVTAIDGEGVEGLPADYVIVRKRMLARPKP